MNKKLIIPTALLTATLFTTLAINHTNTALATENSSTVSEESTTEDESEASTNHEIQPVSDKLNNLGANEPLVRCA